MITIKSRSDIAGGDLCIESHESEAHKEPGFEGSHHVQHLA
jgi:hypothetical protein